MGGKIECLECGEILHSLYRHDFKRCKCKQGSFVDGGFDYTRYGGKSFDKIKFITHFHREKE